MPRYFFQTHDDDAVTEDDFGLHLSDLEAVKAAAARSLAELALDVLPGCDERRLRVDVYDEGGRTVLTTELVFKVLVAVS